jgi:hypothetical protein
MVEKNLELLATIHRILDEHLADNKKCKIVLWLSEEGVLNAEIVEAL